MCQLFQRSIAIILQHQSSSGAYPASPCFPTYRYCWFRDGSYIAYATGLVGEQASAARFHAWAAAVINARSDVVLRTIRKAQAGQPLGGADLLRTRYTVDGCEAWAQDWPDHQLDGFATWLWALAEHNRSTGARLPQAWLHAADLVTGYLMALWQGPCYDCWEELPGYLHPYTLAATYAGLRAVAGLLPGRTLQATAAAEEIRRFCLSRGVWGGRLIKSFAPTAGSPPLAQADGSLLGAMHPFALLAATDPIAQATIAQIERDLHRPGGGVYRYRADTYYGGGEWTLLGAWLGWHYAQIGDHTRARELCRWVEEQADESGFLPEQVSTHLLAPGRYAEWLERWGPVAKPLLWSHAMYLILDDALRRSGCR